MGLELKENGIGVEIILNSEINIVFSGVGIKNNNFSWGLKKSRVGVENIIFWGSNKAKNESFKKKNNDLNKTKIILNKARI